MTKKKNTNDTGLIEAAEYLAREDVRAFDAERDPFEDRSDWRDAIRLDDPESFDWEPDHQPPAPRKYESVEPTNFRAAVRERRARRELDAKLMLEEQAEANVAHWLGGLGGAA